MVHHTIYPASCQQLPTLVWGKDIRQHPATNALIILIIYFQDWERGIDTVVVLDLLPVSSIRL